MNSPGLIPWISLSNAMGFLLNAMDLVLQIHVFPRSIPCTSFKIRTYPFEIREFPWISLMRGPSQDLQGNVRTLEQ